MNKIRRWYNYPPPRVSELYTCCLTSHSRIFHSCEDVTRGLYRATPVKGWRRWTHACLLWPISRGLYRATPVKGCKCWTHACHLWPISRGLYRATPVKGCKRWTFACHIWPISRGLNRSTPGPTRDLGLYSFNVQILSTFQTSKAWRTYSDLKSSEITRF